MHLHPVIAATAISVATLGVAATWLAGMTAGDVSVVIGAAIIVIPVTASAIVSIVVAVKASNVAVVAKDAATAMNANVSAVKDDLKENSATTHEIKTLVNGNHHAQQEQIQAQGQRQQQQIKQQGEQQEQIKQQGERLDKLMELVSKMAEVAKDKVAHPVAPAIPAGPIEVKIVELPEPAQAPPLEVKITDSQMPLAVQAPKPEPDPKVKK